MLSTFSAKAEERLGRDGRVSPVRIRLPGYSSGRHPLHPQGVPNARDWTITPGS
jgi:hypothetical protein